MNLVYSVDTANGCYHFLQLAERMNRKVDSTIGNLVNSLRIQTRDGKLHAVSYAIHQIDQ